MATQRMRVRPRSFGNRTILRWARAPPAALPRKSTAVERGRKRAKSLGMHSLHVGVGQALLQPCLPPSSRRRRIPISDFSPSVLSCSAAVAAVRRTRASGAMLVPSLTRAFQPLPICWSGQVSMRQLGLYYCAISDDGGRQLVSVMGRSRTCASAEFGEMGWDGPRRRAPR